jgi:general secretion pathway protein M
MLADQPLLSRLAAVGLLALLIAVVYAGAVEPILASRAQQVAEIDRLQDTIARFEARQVDREGLRRTLDALHRDTRAQQAYLAADNVTLAAAQLQSRIRDVTEAAGAELVSTQVVDGTGQDEAFPRITLRADIRADTGQLLMVFHALESDKPYLFVDNVSIATHVVAAARRDGQTAGRLSVRYEVYSYIWTGTAQTGEGA